MEEDREELIRLLDIPYDRQRIVFNCMEAINEIFGECIFSTPTKEEIQLLKPIIDFRLNVQFNVPRIVNRNNFCRYYIVAGGYAAFVAGKTNDYGDIDIFTSSPPQFRRNLFNAYEDGFQLVDKPPYQYIHTNFKCNLTIREYMEEILMGFDLDICSVAYTRLNDEYIKVERKKPLNKNTIMKIKPDRFFKYAKRQKNVNSLKHLALFTFLKHAKPDEKEYFNNTIVPRFDFS
jgi:hypothetical protein